jgi:sec-independent protein translocase protein TatA
MGASTTVFAAFGFSGQELVLVLLILLVLFGGSKLPGLARGLGLSIKEFKKAAREDEPEAKPPESKKNEPPPAPGAN